VLLHDECRRCSSHLGLESIGDQPFKSATHGRYDARPTVTFLAVAVPNGRRSTAYRIGDDS